MFRNVASQKWRVFAWNSSGPMTGDAANITAYITKDDGTPAATNDTNPTQVSSTNEPGYYDFDLTQAETDGGKLSLSPKSSTSGVTVIACPPVVYTRPLYSSVLGVTSGGKVPATVAAGDIATDAITAASVKSDAVTKIQSGLATPTNITAGTITTATNLTNLPSIPNGWITAAGITDGALTAAKFASGAFAAVWSALTSGLTTAGTIGKLIVDNLNATVSSRAATGAAMTLTSGERTAIANEVESQIIDDTDSEKVLQAIVDKIASANPSLDDLTLGAIASAVRTELTTELGRIDAAVSSRLATGSYTAPPSASTVTDAVWAKLVSGLTTSGSVGKLIADNLNATITSRAATGAAMTLTSGERTAIANEVESQIIDDTDTEKVLQAIIDKIASANPSLEDLTLGAIAAAVREELETELSRIDAAVSSRLASGSYSAPPSAATVTDAVWAKLVSSLTVDGSVGELLTTVLAEAELSRKLLEADVVVDTSQTPWQLVALEKGTGELGEGVELLRRDLRDVGGGDVVSTDTVIGQVVT